MIFICSTMIVYIISMVVKSRVMLVWYIACRLFSLFFFAMNASTDMLNSKLNLRQCNKSPPEFPPTYYILRFSNKTSRKLGYPISLSVKSRTCRHLSLAVHRRIMRTFQTLNVSEIVTENTGNIRLNQWEVTRPGSCSVDIRTNKGRNLVKLFARNTRCFK